MDYPLLNAFMTMMWFFLWVLWIFLLFRIIGDIFRSDDLGGWGKTGWLVFVILLPFLGVFVYVVARGHGMSGREHRRARQQEEYLRAYIRDSAGPAKPTTPAEQLTKIAELRDHGDISEAEFQRAKEKILV